jgi:flagellar motor switch protein FliG
MDVDRIDPEERRRVIEEFRRIGPLIPAGAPSGIDLSSPPPEIQMAAEETQNKLPTTPFDFLQQAEEETLLQVLEGERPQTVALVLSHLPAERAGEILSRLAQPLQIDVVRRLIDLQNTDPATLREIEQTLASRLTQQVKTQPQQASGSDVVAKILAACPGNVASGILDQFAEHDEALARRLGRRTIEFDELGCLDDATLLAVVHAAESEVLEAALLGSSPLLVERVLCLLDPHEAKTLRSRLQQPGPIRLSDLEEARQRIAALAQRLQYGKGSAKRLAA